MQDNKLLKSKEYMVLVFVLVLSMFPGAALASAELGDLGANLQHICRGVCGHNHIAAVEASGFGLNHHFGGFLGVRDGCCYRNRNWGSFDILEDHNSAGTDCLQEGALKVDHNSSGFIRMRYTRGAHAWLENQIRAHDNATTTIPSPERSTYRLAWLSASFQTVIQVLEVEYETPVPPTADLFVQKTSSTATGAYANQQFAFKVFNNAALTSQVGSTQYLSPGRSFSITLDPDRTYYVAEVAENGWNCTTPGISTKTVNGVTYYYRSITPSAGGTYSVSFNNEPVIRKNISLQKGINAPTSCTGLIRNNAMYSLAGAATLWLSPLILRFSVPSRFKR